MCGPSFFWMPAPRFFFRYDLPGRFDEYCEYRDWLGHHWYSSAVSPQRSLTGSEFNVGESIFVRPAYLSDFRIHGKTRLSQIFRTILRTL